MDELIGIAIIIPNGLVSEVKINQLFLGDILRSIFRITTIFDSHPTCLCGDCATELGGRLLLVSFHVSPSIGVIGRVGDMDSCCCLSEISFSGHDTYYIDWMWVRVLSQSGSNDGELHSGEPTREDRFEWWWWDDEGSSNLWSENNRKTSQLEKNGSWGRYEITTNQMRELQGDFVGSKSWRKKRLLF